ncbi:MAG: ASPIC/UnbV domain-containing protein, partial [Cyclobacteriaceae bacterium]
CFDYNNDGYKDIYFNNEFAFSSYPNQLLENQGDLTFQDVAIGTSLMNTRSGYGCAAGDLNNDGKQDLVLVNSNEEKSVRIFINQADVGNWSQISLVGRSVDKFGIGTRLAWYANEVEYKSEVTVGSGYRSQNSYRQHIGLGANVEIDSLVIFWMDGSKEKYENVLPNQHYLLIQGSGLTSFSSENLAAAITASNTLSDPIEIDDVSTDLSDSHSIARAWNEVLLSGIRGDFARPTVHARNLFHISLAMYDAWAITTGKSSPIFIGNTMGGFESDFSGFTTDEEVSPAAEEAISFAVYRLIDHRFANSPSANETIGNAYQLMTTLGYNPDFVSIDYQIGNPAALGNFIASQIIEFGLQDGSNEENGYANKHYMPVNEALQPELGGNPNISDPNRWQPLELVESIDQSGQPVANSPPFLSPEWGRVVPFALQESDLTIHQRDGQVFWVYHDPGPPPQLGSDATEQYKWNFEVVSLWSSHLDPNDETMVEISPISLGNISEEEYPTTFEEYISFYPSDGTEMGTGYPFNPILNVPYESQLVPRGDYTRVLAEFWADGPDSETPPGHWFSILNYVTDHPAFNREFMGSGEKLELLEWDVKSYVTLGGAMHDAAIAAWGIKGYYDYIRPISALRYVAGLGQSTDEELPNYHVDGIELIDGFIEMVGEGDPLLGESQANLNKIKLRAWKGPDYIDNPESDMAGVDWILAENWWPYQRPSFVTPPFAGYISGHSTFSRAAAEVMTLLTGSEYFPGGLGEFNASKNEFLVFEEGPSTDVALQWAKYKDASDQCSLSRIWGGIHPPADDIPGRLIGKVVGHEAFEHALKFFEKNTVLSSEEPIDLSPVVFPNPLAAGATFRISGIKGKAAINVWSISGRMILSNVIVDEQGMIPFRFSEAGVYVIEVVTEKRNHIRKILVQ